eukprot:3175210-Pyramimonas_sp.AAC.1
MSLSTRRCSNPRPFGSFCASADTLHASCGTTRATGQRTFWSKLRKSWCSSGVISRSSSSPLAR